MLSRGNSSASKRLRRAKSSSSFKQRNTAPGLDRIDPKEARQLAITAASLAFERAGDRGGNLGDGTAGTSILYGAHDQPGELRRRQSIRFAGPNAVPIIQKPITRRQAPSFKDESSCSKAQPRHMHSSSRSESEFTALPPVESISSTPSSYRKLRKAKSMFTPLRPPPFTFVNATPKDLGVSGNHIHQSSSGKRREMADKNKMSQRRSLSFSYISVGDGACRPLAYDQDAAIRVARDQYLHQLEQQRLKQRPSVLSLGKRRSQKAMRKTVRTSSTNSYGSAIASAVPVETGESRTFGRRAKHLSISIKTKLKRVFHRVPSSETCFPDQQVDANRLHFGDPLTTTSGVRHQDRGYPAPDGELLARVNSRASSTYRMPVHLARAHSPGSIRSARSGSPSLGKSRVTSWTVSSAANTMNSMTKKQLLEKKRLSIIQENGGPHQPSSSAGMIGNAARKGYAVFRKPLRGSVGSGRVTAPVDSQRVFSALQRRIDENSPIAGQADVPRSRGPRRISRQASEESLRKVSSESYQIGPSHVQTLENQSEESFHAPRTIRFGNTTMFNPSPSPSTDDVFRPSSRASAQQKLINIEGFSYQQIAERNERLLSGQKKPLREVKSAFFPSTSYYERNKLSPYRRALHSSMNEAYGVIKGDDIVKPDSRDVRTPSGQSHPGDNLTISESVYSRSTNGHPKPFETSYSMSRSDSSGEPGTALVMIKDEVDSQSNMAAPVSKHQRAASVDESSMEWKGWMPSSVGGIADRNHEKRRTQKMGFVMAATHKREGAQIDSESTQIRGRSNFDLGPQQPLTTVYKTGVARPQLRHRTSEQMIEKFPLRFPLIERPQPSSAENRSRKALSGKHEPSFVSNDSSNNENQRSGPRMHSKPSQVRLQSSQTTLRSQDSYTYRSDSITGAYTFNRFSPNGLTGNPVIPEVISKRCSPEREERLRRMQSSRSISLKEKASMPFSLKEKASIQDWVHDTRHHQAGQREIREASSPVSVESDRREPAKGSMNGRRAGSIIGGRMVNIGSSPAFL